MSIRFKNEYHEIEIYKGCVLQVKNNTALLFYKNKFSYFVLSKGFEAEVDVSDELKQKIDNLIYEVNFQRMKKDHLQTSKNPKIGSYVSVYRGTGRIGVVGKITKISVGNRWYNKPEIYEISIIDAFETVQKRNKEIEVPLYTIQVNRKDVRPIALPLDIEETKQRAIDGGFDMFEQFKKIKTIQADFLQVRENSNRFDKSKALKEILKRTINKNETVFE